MSILYHPDVNSLSNRGFPLSYSQHLRLANRYSSQLTIAFASNKSVIDLVHGLLLADSPHSWPPAQ